MHRRRAARPSVITQTTTAIQGHTFRALTPGTRAYIQPSWLLRLAVNGIG